MANIYKNAGFAISTTDLTTIYTVPTGRTAIIKNIQISNEHGSNSSISGSGLTTITSNGGGAGSSSGAATAGTANTGGGGGGTSTATGGAGGKGVVILSVPDASYSGTTTGSPTVATGVSGKTVMTFNGSGSYTA